MYKRLFILFVIALLPLAVFAQDDVDSSYLSDAAKDKMGITDDVEDNSNLETNDSVIENESAEKESETTEEPETLTIETPELPPAGSTKDSPFYALDRAMEKLRLRLARDETAKAQLRLSFAEERLAEAKELVAANKLDLAEETIADYQSELDAAKAEIEAAVEAGKDMESVAEHVREMTAKHIEVLQRVLEKVPDTAKPAIMHAINVSQKGQDTAVQSLEQMRERKALMEAEQEQEQEQELEQEQTQEGQESEETTNATEESGENSTETAEGNEETDEGTTTDKGKGWH